MNTSHLQENLFENGGELILKGTPQMVMQRIVDGIRRVNSEGYPSSVNVKTGSAPDFTPSGQMSSYRCVIFGKSAEVGKEIGCIELQPIPEEQTIFKLMYLPSCSSFFEHLIPNLLAEFQRLGFIYFEEEKPRVAEEGDPRLKDSARLTRKKRMGEHRDQDLKRPANLERKKTITPRRQR